MALSYVQPYGYSSESCGYCKDASSGQRRPNSRTWIFRSSPRSVTQSHACISCQSGQTAPKYQRRRTIAGAAPPASSIDVPLRLALHVCALYPRAVRNQSTLAHGPPLALKAYIAAKLHLRVSTRLHTWLNDCECAKTDDQTMMGESYGYLPFRVATSRRCSCSPVLLLMRSTSGPQC
ncbi:hypothetical protein SVAN01_00223 [Stagonosporopsis vannaccii]|nr:hypothetical protein SVAN01_00223 [Stagonosporopsis vannaccii]